MRKDLEKTPKNDHEDYYYLPACYALDRLLPRQVEALAQQWATMYVLTATFLTFAALKTPTDLLRFALSPAVVGPSCQP